jgi:hypothetical protein
LTSSVELLAISAFSIGCRSTVAGHRPAALAILLTGRGGRQTSATRPGVARPT